MIPEVMVGIADRQIGLEDLFAHLGEPAVTVHAVSPDCPSATHP
jgi:hypothetical protein